ncbi:hypothetical protein [Rhodopirellula halodulae]|uniref:hypothetical protein n=1 Tax=Rhodopirellula halodulae TaxID=2894198 RepID=UPI001E4325A7|nr:hypothetical protein [Rhodopirellula sp. JC737]MCC9655189.1 hypothetical protein [Rhodopirellula sp. JC737]
MHTENPIAYIKRIIGSAIAFAALSSTLALTAEPSGSPTQYVVLEGGGPDQGPGPDVKANFHSLAHRFEPMPSDSKRMVAYGVQQLRILSRSVPRVRRDVEQALDLAEQTGVPVFFHVDSCYGWGADDSLPPNEQPSIRFWAHAEMREWTEFPTDNSPPTQIPRAWLHWGPWCSPAPAVPAFGSPKFTAFAASQLDQAVLDPLAERLETWRSQNLEHLFAGINIAWEAHIPDWNDGGMRRLIQREKGSVKAGAPRSVQGIEMTPSLVGSQLGFASLHWRNWNETRLRTAAKNEGISRDAKFRQLCYEAIHDYMESLSKTCHDRGIKRDRIYTHIVALSTVQPASTLRPPIWTAVNAYSTPGFTMDNRGGARFDLNEILRQIRSARGEREVRFGMVESYFRLGNRIYVNNADQCQRELEAMFHSGATLQVFYGGFPLNVRTPKAALLAIEQWLDHR